MHRKNKIMGCMAGLALISGVGAAGSVGFAQTHGGHAGMTHESAKGAVAPAAPQGVLIRESKIQDRSLAYRLYSWDERNVMMKGMEGHEMPGMDKAGKATHHLMVFIKAADGKPLAGGKVGFIVTGPDKAEFKTLTMAMSDGYGADVPLQAQGVHTVKTKAVFGGTTLSEEFAYTVK